MAKTSHVDSFIKGPGKQSPMGLEKSQRKLERACKLTLFQASFIFFCYNYIISPSLSSLHRPQPSSHRPQPTLFQKHGLRLEIIVVRCLYIGTYVYVCVCVFLNKTCLVFIMLFVRMFSRLTTWYWITNWWEDYFSHPQHLLVARLP